MISHALRFLIPFLSVAFAMPAWAQLQVNPVADADSLANALLGTASGGILISNATLNCPGVNQSGTFTFSGTAPNLGMASGILLTCGTVQNAVGPNNVTGATGAPGLPGDPDLDSLVVPMSYDACVLEFDMFIPGDTVKFNYVFASEEYNEYVGGGVNDVFGFFISGPGITGPYTGNSMNIALLPGSATATVNINDVNCNFNSQYYICNDHVTTVAGCNCPTTAQPDLQYDGLTTVLTAIAAVIPCNTYHLKIAVSDVGDGILDSGVFLEAGSLQSNAVDIELTSLYTDPGGNPAAVEDCDFNTEFQIHLDTYTLIGDSIVNTGAQDTVCFTVQTGGTATEGVDYDFLPDTICFYPGDTLLTLTISALSDGIVEGVDSLLITLVPVDSLLGGCGALGATALVLIYDELVLDAYPDTAVCIGQSVTLHVNAAPNISWSPASSLSCQNCLDPVATPTSGGPHVYTVTAGLSPCLASASVTVTVNDPSPVYTADTVEICLGQTAALVATNATDYTWSPDLHLNATTGASVEATPPQTTTYTVTGQNACGATSEDVVVVVHSLPVINTSGDASICPEHTAPISASSPGAVSYAWTPAESLSDANSASPTADPENTTTYYVTVVDGNGCASVDSVVVGVFDVPDLNAQAFPGVIYPYGYNTQGPPNSDSVALLTVENASSVSWFPTAGLSDPTSTAPLATPSQTTTYYASALSANGCQMADSVVVEVVLFSEVDIPNAFTPNGDGKNDLFRLFSRGGFTLSLFAVFDRWGQQVFSTTEVAAGRSLGWNGYVDGKPAPIGTYAYVVRGTGADGTPVELQGNVTLLR